MKPLSARFTASPRYKWEVLALLWIAFFLNQADRQIFNVVLPMIKADLGLTDTEAGLIATCFNLVFALCVPIAGYIGDRFSRKWILVFSIMLWSVATMLTGLSNGLLMFIIFRSTATGVGEAFFGPSNYAMLAEYHVKTRAKAMSIHQTSYYLGVIVSGFLAGYVAEHWGWKNAFFLFGGVGVIHGIVMMFRLRDKKQSACGGQVPENGAQDGAAVESGIVEPAAERIKIKDSVRILFTVPTALMLTIGFSGLIFVLTGYLTWTPTFLHEKFSMSLAQAGFNSMFYTHIAAFVGVLFAGSWSDRLATKNPANRILLQSAGLLFAAPFIVLMGNSKVLWMVYIGFAGFGFARAFFDANTYPVLYDVIPPKYHASATGIMQMTGFAVGSFSPVILGALKPYVGLSGGISLLSVVWVICSLMLLAAYKFTYKRDYDKVHGVQNQ